jgi:DNA-binding NarL/FixJ family response regulator
VSVRVLVADDQALVRAGFRKILEADPTIEVVGEAADGLEAVECSRLHVPDVVLMDIRMPGLDGIAATRRLSEELKDGPRVLVLTTFGLEEYVYEALRAGASGFLLKDVPPRSSSSAPSTSSLAEMPCSTRRSRARLSRRSPAGRPHAGSSPRGSKSSPRANATSSLWLRAGFRMQRSPGSWWWATAP